MPAMPDTGDSDVAVSVASTSTSVTDCQTGASATTSDSVAMLATGTAAMPSCVSRMKLALMRGASEPSLIDQDVAVRDDRSTASVSDSTGGKFYFLPNPILQPELFNKDNVLLPTD